MVSKLGGSKVDVFKTLLLGYWLAIFLIKTKVAGIQLLKLTGIKLIITIGLVI